MLKQTLQPSTIAPPSPIPTFCHVFMILASHDSAANHPRGGTLPTHKLLSCLPLIRLMDPKCFVVRPWSKLHFRRDSSTLRCYLQLHRNSSLSRLYCISKFRKRKDLSPLLPLRHGPTSPFSLDVESSVLVFCLMAHTSVYHDFLFRRGISRVRLFTLSQRIISPRLKGRMSFS